MSVCCCALAGTAACKACGNRPDIDPKENIISCLENAANLTHPSYGTTYFFTTQKRMDLCGGEDGLRKAFLLPPDPHCKVIVVPPTIQYEPTPCELVKPNAYFVMKEDGDESA